VASVIALRIFVKKKLITLSLVLNKSYVWHRGSILCAFLLRIIGDRKTGAGGACFLLSI
jgi:hypothetical protein